MEKTTNLTAKKILDAIASINAVTIDDMDTALAIVENEEILNSEFKNITKALDKMVKYTEEEQEYEKKVERILKGMNEENQSEKLTELNQMADKNKALVDSINDKKDLEQENNKKMSEKAFDLSKLEKIDKEKLMKKRKEGEKEILVNTLTFKQLAGLKPLFK